MSDEFDSRSSATMSPAMPADREAHSGIHNGAARVATAALPLPVVSFAPPIAATFARATALNAAVRVRLGADESQDWVNAGDLFAPGSNRVPDLLKAVGSASDLTDVRVQMSFLFLKYAWRVVSTGLACYLIDSRVPALDIKSVSLQVGERGASAELAVLTPRFTGLESDLAAGHSDARTVPSLQDLRAELVHSAVDRHLLHVIETLAGQRILGRPFFHAALADTFTKALLWLGRFLDISVEQSEAEAEAFLGLLPYRGSAGVTRVELPGSTELHMRRASCCLAYRSSGHGYCAGCVVLPEEERQRTVRQHVIELKTRVESARNSAR